MKARAISPAITEKAWPLIEPWVLAALDEAQANVEPDAIRVALAVGAMQLWLAWDEGRAHGCCVTELYGSAKGKTCGLVIVAGMDFKRWRPLIADIKEWARREGCVRLEAAGRDGWQRYVRADGWRKVRTVIEMSI